MNMYFIAIAAPVEINSQVLKWKIKMRDDYGCLVAMRSPAHVTLVPPFWMKQEEESSLLNAISDFSILQNSFAIELHNFSCFKPGVIFVDVTPSAKLFQLQSQLFSFLVAPDSFPIKKENRPFHPHVTIATRDLRKKDFYAAWEIFKEKTYKAVWQVEGISLLRHNKKNWDVIFTSQLNTG